MRKPSRNKIILLIIFFFCLVLGMGIYGICIEPSRLEVRHIWVNDREMGQSLQQKVVLQISDVHLHTIGKNETKLLKTIDALQPDFIFLTGDYIQWNGEYEKALDFLARVKAKNGVWAVMGDYDYSNSRKSCLFCHSPGSAKPSKRHDIKFLRNSIDRIDTPAGHVFIMGIDIDTNEESFNKEGLSFLAAKIPAIILSHSPLVFDLIDDNWNVLILAGDTHGGQVPIPSWFWQLLGYEKNARYEQGWFQKGRKKMYVSRGVGASHFPIRFFKRPEITVFCFEGS